MAFPLRNHDPSRCKAAVHGERVTVWQCRRKPWKDGWCHQHHPDTVTARQKAKEQRWEIKAQRREIAEERNAVALLQELGYTVTRPARRSRG